MRMSRRHLIVTALTFLAATPSGAGRAAGPRPRSMARAKAKGRPKKEIARSIDLSGLVFPVFDEKESSSRTTCSCRPA